MDAINSNDEGHYDKESTIKFAVMLADIGLNFTLVPYRNKEHWTEATKMVNKLRPNTVDTIYV